MAFTHKRFIGFYDKQRVCIKKTILLDERICLMNSQQIKNRHQQPFKAVDVLE
jgi:ABC-type transport system involved in Fe-S cluster assembly fused permease/ATPase subunit